MTVRLSLTFWIGKYQGLPPAHWHWQTLTRSSPADPGHESPATAGQGRGPGPGHCAGGLADSVVVAAAVTNPGLA